VLKRTKKNSSTFLSNRQPPHTDNLISLTPQPNSIIVSSFLSQTLNISSDGEFSLTVTTLSLPIGQKNLHINPATLYQEASACDQGSPNQQNNLATKLITSSSISDDNICH
jgi:hypothetical protein